MKLDRLQEIKRKAKNFFQDAPPSHDWSHVKRVWRLCMKIGRKLEADLEVLQLASFLHDIARSKEDQSKGKIDHAEKGAEMAREILKKYDYSKETIQKVVACIKSHRFRNEEKPKSIEAKILFDADKLDSIGAIGIARDFAFSGQIGAKLYDKKILYKGKTNGTRIYSRKDTPYREFLVKLRKIKDKMKTSIGKKIAQKRDKFMHNFFQRMKKEIKGKR